MIKYMRHLNFGKQLLLFMVEIHCSYSFKNNKAMRRRLKEDMDLQEAEREGDTGALIGRVVYLALFCGKEEHT